MKKFILLLILLPSTCLSQFIFDYTGKDTMIDIKQNILLVEKLELTINAIDSYDGQKAIDIPTAFQMRKSKKYFQEGNHICEYSYSLTADKVTYGDNDVIMTNIDFKTKKFKKSHEKGNEKDHYKTKFKDEKIKEREKKKPKPTVVGKEIIVR